MLNEKKNEVTEEIKEARQLSEEDLEQVTGGNIDSTIGQWCATDYQPAQTITTSHDGSDR